MLQVNLYLRLLCGSVRWGHDPARNRSLPLRQPAPAHRQRVHHLRGTVSPRPPLTTCRPTCYRRREGRLTNLQASLRARKLPRPRSHPLLCALPQPNPPRPRADDLLRHLHDRRVSLGRWRVLLGKPVAARASAADGARTDQSVIAVADRGRPLLRAARRRLPAAVPQERH